MGSGQAPGWYYAQGDPPGTHRYWDGRQWVGGPQPIAAAAPYTHGGEGYIPELGKTLAEPWQRIVARLIDGLVAGVIGAVIALAVISDDDFFSFRRTLLQTALGAVYTVFFIGLLGATPGKMAMGIAVVRQRDGVTPPGFDVAIMRWIVEAVGILSIVGALASIVILIVSLVFLFTDPRRRTVNDRIAKTYVIKTR
jgi:uncharacterized RDD family membrane protein YckC